MNEKNFKLSYMVGSVEWTGKIIAKRAFDDICKGLDDMLNLGIDEVMLTGYHLEEPSDFDVDEETLKVGNALRDRGMKGAQHHSLSSVFTTPGTSQEKVIQHLKKCVDYTANLNADVVVFHLPRPLGHWSGIEDETKVFNNLVTEYSLDTVIETICGNMHIAGEYAKERGVKIALENLDRFHPLSNMEYLPRIVNGADSDAVGYCLDTGHAWCGGNSVVEWVKIMGDKLFTTHVHDNHGLPAVYAGTTDLINPCTSGIDEHLSPGFGTISWVDFIRALWDNNYTRTLNFETGGWAGLEKEEGLRSAIKFWRTCEFLASK